MSFKDILFMSVLFVLLPMWIGYLWVNILRLRGVVNGLLHAWVLGFVTMLAVAQVLLVPLVALHQSLTTALMCWEIALTAPALAAFLMLLRRWRNRAVSAADRGRTGRGRVGSRTVVERTGDRDGRRADGGAEGNRMAGKLAGMPGTGRKAEGRPGTEEGMAAGKTVKMPRAGGSMAAGKTVKMPKAGGSMAAGKSAQLWVVIFGVLAAVLILLQAYIPARYEHRDDDDSRFVSEEVSAVVHDTMYWDDPIGSDQLYWNTGEVKKDLTSPWAMYIAMCSRLSNIPPAVLSHTYLPFFLILLCYGLYLLIGRALFAGNWEKTFLFLIFLSVLHLWGYTSTHTLASMLLLRIWQGKAVCAGFLLPLLFYLMYQVMRRDVRKGWYALLYVASTGACLLSGIGIVTGPVILFLYGIVDFIYNRSWKKTLVIWMAALPPAVCLAYYLFG